MIRVSMDTPPFLRDHRRSKDMAAALLLCPNGKKLRSRGDAELAAHTPCRRSFCRLLEMMLFWASGVAPSIVYKCGGKIVALASHFECGVVADVQGVVSPSWPKVCRTRDCPGPDFGEILMQQL